MILIILIILWDDAIAELQEAVVFNPSNLGVLINPIKSHFGLWKIHHKREDEEKVRLRIISVKLTMVVRLVVVAAVDIVLVAGGCRGCSG